MAGPSLKTVLLALAADHICQAFAGLAQMQSNINSMVRNVTRGRGRGLRGMRGDPRLRQLTNHFLERHFVGYGCWCNFDDDHNIELGRGRGEPLDEWDENCKMLAAGYACARIEGEVEGEPCNEPWAQEYTIDGFE